MQSENKQDAAAPEEDLEQDQAQDQPEGQHSEQAEENAPAEEAAPEGADPAPAAGSDLEAELAETKDRLLRALAEAENVRRRATRDVDAASKRSISNFAREMIQVADNLSRALSSIDQTAAQENEAFKALLTGVEMTAREMQKAFERNHILQVDPLGERFDPQIHEAMFEFEDPSKPAGTVGQVMEPGYTLHGQPLRPAKVGVTKGGPKAAPKVEGDPAGTAPTPSATVQDDVEASAKGGAKAGGENAYEADGKPSGSHLDEEL